MFPLAQMRVADGIAEHLPAQGVEALCVRADGGNGGGAGGADRRVERRLFFFRRKRRRRGRRFPRGRRNRRERARRGNGFFFPRGNGRLRRGSGAGGDGRRGASFFFRARRRDAFPQRGERFFADENVPHALVFEDAQIFEPRAHFSRRERVVPFVSLRRKRGEKITPCRARSAAFFRRSDQANGSSSCGAGARSCPSCGRRLFRRGARGRAANSARSSRALRRA